MKKLLFAVCALAAISLLAPNAGFAQDPDPNVWENRIGVYTSADAASATIASAAAMSIQNLYVVLSNPTNSDGTPATAVDGVEFTMNLTGPTYFVLSSTLAGVGGLDVDPAALGYAAGWATPGLAVTNGMVHLITVQIMLGALADGTNPLRVFLAPATAPSVPGGYMAINVPDSPVLLRACLPSSNDFAEEVFAIGEVPTASQAASFGEVKALFR